MKVKIGIELGNEAMETGRDVAEALGRIAHRIEDNLTPLRVGVGGFIRDENGNTVGEWEVVE